MRFDGVGSSGGENGEEVGEGGVRIEMFLKIIPPPIITIDENVDPAALDRDKGHSGICAQGPLGFLHPGPADANLGGVVGIGEGSLSGIPEQEAGELGDLGYGEKGGSASLAAAVQHRPLQRTANRGLLWHKRQVVSCPEADGLDHRSPILSGVTP